MATKQPLDDDAQEIAAVTHSSTSPVAALARSAPPPMRFPSQQGKNKGLAPKLTAEDAAKIRERLAAGEFMHAIAADYGVNPGRIHEIKTGKRFPVE